MFSPFKKIFTYIQKNASSSNMFGQTSIATTTSTAPATSRLNADEEGGRLEEQLQQEPQIEDEEEEEDDIERQIKTSIIDASKVKSLPIQLDDELADFAHDPVEQQQQQQQLHLEDDQLEEEFLELDDFPNNEIIVIDTDLNSSLASDNVSEDPLAIDTILDSSSVTTNDEVDTSSDILWLKINHQETTTNAANAHQTETSRQTDELRGNTGEPPKPTKTKEEELRSSDGGSDSGLGSETSIIKETTTTTTTTSSSTNSPIKPIRSNLKRRLEVEDGIDLAIPDIASGSSSTQATPQAQKRPKRCINFDNVKVYYFPRQQGFSCVPTAGGCTLGMGARHIAFKTMTLAEHAAELRRAHRNQNQDLQTRGSSTDDSEESEEDYLSESSSSDPDDGSNGFLQPVTPKQRRALLKAAGVRKIDASEKSDCRDIRNSREVCGCSCREFCDPETCACSQAGIKCQVDRAMFPCGCSREACGNTVGRVEFNPTRVRTHYIHTVMRLDLEQRQGVQQQQLQQQSNSYTNGGASGATQSAATSPHCYFMQTQSNYSSGYASPAYTPDSSVSYYQQQQQQQQQQQIVAVNLPGNSAIQQQTQYSGYTQLDSLDSDLFGSNSNGTPAYGELYQSLSYGNAQITSYQTVSYQHTSSPAVAAATAGAVAVNSPAGTPSAFRSCSVPSAPPFGNATTTASSTNSQYQTTASMTAASTTTNGNGCSPRLGGNSVASVAAAAASASSPAEFISLNSPIASSSRLSQINDLLQHNRNTTAALVAVSEGYGGVRISSISSSSSSSAAATNIDSIETPPIVEDAQHRSCMTFEELPPPLINPTPIVTVVETKLPEISAVSSLSANIQGPQPRQPLDVQSLTETT
ncbi:uncharacterized protein Dwil_GK15152 [Drosophila willistoni]|uniref:Cysteine/serine-rich nuclear protein N-terminal domain-containing protein n=1 Tax=Drosophila willistoni TaxID=7260 RepID=B4MVW6_DROWI|nr:uncharacterized protein LOC6641895 [Drosophila willistoni]EDW75836.1 uncharacterized protein Dwil_GK15152 [Drosophila willistoni]